MGVESLEMELCLRGLATSVLLGWEDFNLDNLFILGLVLHPDLGRPESVEWNLGFTGLGLQSLLWRGAVCWVFKILAALGICSVGSISLDVAQSHEHLNKDRIKGEMNTGRISKIGVHLISTSAILT